MNETFKRIHTKRLFLNHGKQSSFLCQKIPKKIFE